MYFDTCKQKSFHFAVWMWCGVLLPPGNSSRFFGWTVKYIASSGSKSSLYVYTWHEYIQRKWLQLWGHHDLVHRLCDRPITEQWVHEHVLNKKAWQPFTVAGACAPSAPAVPIPMHRARHSLSDVVSNTVDLGPAGLKFSLYIHADWNGKIRLF